MATVGTVGTTVATVATVAVRVRGAAAARVREVAVRVREAAVRVREAAVRVVRVVRVGEGAVLGKLRLCLRGHFCSQLARSRQWLRHLQRHLTPGYGKKGT